MLILRCFQFPLDKPHSLWYNSLSCAVLIAKNVVVFSDPMVTVGRLTEVAGRMSLRTQSICVASVGEL